MMELPDRVARPFEPTGNLQLHELGKLTRFHCVRCRREKVANLLAITDGDWSRTICYRCYESLVPQRQQKAKKPALGSPDSAQAAVSKSRNVMPKKPPTISAKKLRMLQRRLPGINALLEFFSTAGIQVELRHDGVLLVNGEEISPIRELPPRGRLTWSQAVNEIAFTYASTKFFKAVDDNVHISDDFYLSPRRYEKGIAIMRGEVRLATITPTRARIPHRRDIEANFLIAGPHWQQVKDAIENVEPELIAEWERDQKVKEAEAERRLLATRRRINRLPEYLGAELIDLCLNASRRIRLERQVAYERPVILAFPIGELTLLPIFGSETKLLAPFRLTRATDTVVGELVITDHDPLPIMVGANIADKDAIVAWTCALLGFADATCIESEWTQSTDYTSRKAQAMPRWQSSILESGHRPAPAARPLKRRWPPTLEPVGSWVQYSGSLVAGHRRRLNDGQTASALACNRARQIGIILRPNETWVRPHTRGVPDEVRIRFQWHAEPELLRILDH